MGAVKRGRERWREPEPESEPEPEPEPAAASVSVAGFRSPKLQRPEICELSLYLPSQSSSLD